METWRFFFEKKNATTFGNALYTRYAFWCFLQMLIVLCSLSDLGLFLSQDDVCALCISTSQFGSSHCDASCSKNSAPLNPSFLKLSQFLKSSLLHKKVYIKSLHKRAHLKATPEENNPCLGSSQSLLNCMAYITKFFGKNFFGWFLLLFPAYTIKLIVLR